VVDKLDINVDAIKGLTEKLSKINNGLHDLSPLFEQMSADFYKYEKTVFQLKGPGQYEDLRKSTYDAKMRKYGFAYPILFATGKLALSLMDRGSSGAVNVITKQGFVIGTSVPYAVYHHSKLPRKKNKWGADRLPYRPLWESEFPRSRMWARWNRLIEAYIKKIQDGAFA
jgi:hypothetical protein